MSTYVDTSTLIKLLVAEPGSEQAGQVWDRAASLVSVSLVEVEARSALAAATRSGRLDGRAHRRAKHHLADLLAQIDRFEVSGLLIAAAAELAESEALRGYDGVHLSAALLAGCEVLTSSDHDLLAAAGRRGLAVADTNG